MPRSGLDASPAAATDCCNDDGANWPLRRAVAVPDRLNGTGRGAVTGMALELAVSCVDKDAKESRMLPSRGRGRGGLFINT